MNSTTNDILPEGYKMTELGALPEEWEVAKLGEVLEVYDKKRIPLSSLERSKMQGSYPYCGANGIIDYVNDYIFDGEYLLLAEDGGFWNKYENTAYIMNNKFWVNNHAHIIKAIENKTTNRFLLYWFIYDDIDRFTSGTTRKKLNQSTMIKIPLPLPPLPEQQKIAAVLSAVQEAKEKTQAVIDATKSLKKSMMKHLFTYGPVPPEEKENVPRKETEIGKVPEDWDVVKLGEIFDVQQGKQLSAKESKEGKIKKPFLRTSNINWGHIDISSIDEMYFTSEEFKKLKLESGDILVCEGGDVGRTALYRGELSICAYQNHLHRLRSKKDNVDVECFVFWMNYAINQKKMYTHSANRTTIPNLSGSRLKEFMFPLPPLPVQQKIASILSAIDAKIEAEENRKQALEELFKTLLHNLMTAKIRVNNLEIKV